MEPSHEGKPRHVGADFLSYVWAESWTYIKTVVDIAHEPILILDKDLRVMAANDSFYHTFQVEPKDTEQNSVYKLGSGQWNIPELRKLLQDILPKRTFFKGFEVARTFPGVGRKVMILSARQIHFKETAKTKLFPPTIFLAMEDVTDMVAVAQTLAEHTKKFESKLMERAEKIESHLLRLEQEVSRLQSLEQKGL